MVETRVRRDAVEPGPNHGSSFEAGPPLPCSKQRLLHQVLRLIERPEHAIAVQVKLFPIRLGESGESGLISRARRLPLIPLSDSQKLPPPPASPSNPWSPSPHRGPHVTASRRRLVADPVDPPRRLLADSPQPRLGPVKRTSTGAAARKP